MTLVHAPLSRVGTVNPTLIDPDRLARAHARREVKVLNPDAVILRARRVATRGLPEIATLPCGCHHDRLCPEAAYLYAALEGASSREWKGYAEAFIDHRRTLAPRAVNIRPRLSAEGLWHAAQVLKGQP